MEDIMNTKMIALSVAGFCAVACVCFVAIPYLSVYSSQGGVAAGKGSAGCGKTIKAGAVIYTRHHALTKMIDVAKTDPESIRNYAEYAKEAKIVSVLGKDEIAGVCTVRLIEYGGFEYWEIMIPGREQDGFVYAFKPDVG
jgi:hypothetical protein